MCFQYLNTLTNLSILRLKHCHNLIEGATEQIAVLTALRKLDLSYTPTKQLPSLPALTNLEKLNIGHTNGLS
jgi:Leucine-rich repeat (LRR) protein